MIHLMNTKTCFTCSEAKPLTEFHNDKTKSFGKSNECKACKKHRSNVAYHKNLDTSRKARLEKYRERKNAGLFSSSYKHAVLGHVHRPRVKSQMPKWANVDAMFKVYELKALWNQVFPEDPLSVDHIVPLKNPLVCGLHTHSNIRLILDRDNRVKNNNFYEPEQDVFFITKQVYYCTAT